MPGEHVIGVPHAVAWDPVEYRPHLALCRVEVALQEPHSILWFPPTPPTL